MNHLEFGFFDELQKLANPGNLKVNMGAPKPTVTAGPNLGPGVSTNLRTTMGRPAAPADPSAPARLGASSGPLPAPLSADAMRGAMRRAASYVRRMRG